MPQTRHLRPQNLQSSMPAWGEGPITSQQFTHVCRAISCARAPRVVADLRDLTQPEHLNHSHRACQLQAAAHVCTSRSCNWVSCSPKSCLWGALVLRGFPGVSQPPDLCDQVGMWLLHLTTTSVSATSGSPPAHNGAAASVCVDDRANPRSRLGRPAPFLGTASATAKSKKNENFMPTTNHTL